MGTARRLVINTLERASSNDILRAQQFGASLLGEVLRGLFDDQRWPTTYPGYAKRSVATETPLRGHVLSGLMVQPDNTGYLTVTAGSLLACITPATADDSVVQEVVDPGVTNPATLTFTANASGSVRFDIVEVSIVDTVIEQGTVAIFNESTEQFVPTPATAKVREPRLSYRIRNGVGGSGLPAAAAGWMPLAVVHVKNGAAGFSTCDVWDVRPLLADRVFDNEPTLQPNGSTSRYVRARARGVAGLQGSQAGAETGWRGRIDSEFNGYRAGGELRMSAPSSTGFGGADDDANSLISLSPSISTVYSLVAGQPYFIAAVFPGGLPRWVRYSQDPDTVAGARVPRGPRGILLLTTQQPNAGGYYTGLTPAATTGFTAAAPGVALFSGLFDTALGGAMRDNVTRLAAHPTAVLGGVAGTGTAAVTWTFSTANSGYPAHATELILDLDFSSDLDQAARITVEHKAGVVVFDEPVNVKTGAAGTVLHRIRIPLWTGEVDGSDTGSTILKVTATTAAMTIVARIAGWATA